MQTTLLGAAICSMLPALIPKLHAETLVAGFNIQSPYPILATRRPLALWPPRAQTAR